MSSLVTESPILTVPNPYQFGPKPDTVNIRAGIFQDLTVTVTFTITGTITFNSAIIITPTTNQIVLGTTRTVTINAPTPAGSSRVHTIPDVGANANFVMTAGSQTIGGAKTLTTQLNFTTGTTTFMNVNAPLGGAYAFSITNTGAASSIIFPEAIFLAALDTAQTFSGAKSFSAAPILTAASDQLTFRPGGAGTVFSINASSPAADRVYTLPDAGSAADFVMTAGNQSVAGVKTFSDATDSSSSTTGGTIMSGGVGIAKKLYLGTGLYLPSASATASELNMYTTGTHTTTWSGIWAAPAAGNILFTRTGSLVTLLIPTTLDTATTAAVIVNDTALPAYLRPAASVYVGIRVRDNGVDISSSGLAIIASTGIITISRLLSGAVFSGANNSGFYASPLTYIV